MISQCNLFAKAMNINSMVEEKKIVCFLSLIGDSGLDTVRLQVNKTFQIEFKFNIIVQKGHSFDNFLADFRETINTTEYPNQDEMIRVRVVTDLIVLVSRS